MFVVAFGSGNEMSMEEEENLWYDIIDFNGSNKE